MNMNDLINLSVEYNDGLTTPNEYLIKLAMAIGHNRSYAELGDRALANAIANAFCRAAS